MSILNQEVANAANNLLPEFIRNLRDKEENDWKKAIFDHLPQILTTMDNFYIDFWIGVLDTFCSSETFTFTQPELEKIATILYDFITKTKFYQEAIEAVSLFNSIIDPKKQKLNLKFKWRALYDVLYHTMISQSKTSQPKYPPKFANTLIDMALICRHYFEETATEEMLSEWTVFLDISKDSYVLGHSLLCTFLPVNHGKHGLWIDLMLREWTKCRSIASDFMFLRLFSELSYFPTPDVDYDAILDFATNTVLNAIGIPTALISQQTSPVQFYREDYCAPFFDSRTTFEQLLEYYAGLLINRFTENTEKVKSILVKTLKLIEPYCTTVSHVEDRSTCESPIALMALLCIQLSRRIKGNQSNLKPITNDLKLWFAETLTPLVVMTQMNEDPDFSHCSLFVQIAPEVSIRPLLTVVEHQLAIEHLRSPGIRLLFSLAPTILTTRICIEEFEALMYQTAEDIDFKDTEKSSSVFALLTSVSAFTKIENSTFNRAVWDACIRFAENATGSDFETPLSEMMTMLCSWIRSIDKGTQEYISKSINAKQPDLQTEGLMLVAEAIGEHASSLYEFACTAETKKSVAVLKALIRQANGCAFERKEAILKAIDKALASKKTKVRYLGGACIKWLLRTMLTTYPMPPTGQGLASQEKPVIEWHVPSEAECQAAMEISKDFLARIEALLQGDRDSQNKGAMLAHHLFKGIQSGVSAYDLDHEDEPYMFQPFLAVFSFKPLASIWERLLDIVKNAILSPKTERKPRNELIKLLTTADAPRDPSGARADQLRNEYTLHRDATRVRLLKKPLECIPFYTLYWKAIYIHALRQSLIQIPFPKCTRVVIDAIYPLIKEGPKKIRENTVNFYTQIISRYRCHFYEFLHKCINELKDSKNEDEFNGLCDVISAISFLPPCNETYTLLFDVATILCRRLSPSNENNSARVLRQMVIFLYDKFDFSDEMTTVSYTDRRKSLINTAISVKNDNLTSTETEKYSAAVVCSIVSCKPTLYEDSLKFIIDLLLSDSKVVRDCVVNVIPDICEHYITRQPYPDKKRFEEVTEENYDEFDFIDRSDKKHPKHCPLFEAREVIETKYNEAKILFERFVDTDKTVGMVLELFINAQVHKEESFSKPQLFFWFSLCRLLGVPFMLKMLSKVEKLAEEQKNGTQIIAAEVFGGIMRSIKHRPYSQIKAIQPDVFAFAKHILQSMEPEFHSIWFYAFSTLVDRLDSRRFFWLYDYMMQVPVKSIRGTSLLCDILSVAVPDSPKLADAILERSQSIIFPALKTDLEQTRDSALRIIIALLPYRDSVLDVLLDKSPSFVSRWLISLFSSQSAASLVPGKFILEHIKEWCLGIMCGDEEEEQITRTALSTAAMSNWLGALFTGYDKFEKLVDEVSSAFIFQSTHWQVQTVLILMLESFISTVPLYVPDKLVKRIVEEMVMPGLEDPHTDVSDAASQLLVFAVRNFALDIGPVMEACTKMLGESESVTKRIAGAKGLTGLITGTVIFQDIPQYVLDSFASLAAAAESDTSVEPTISQFFNEFWATYEDNMTNEAEELLSQYKSSLKPSYIT